MNFFLFFLVLIVPGFIGALVYHIICITHKLSNIAVIAVALLLDLISFTIMITGLYYLKGVGTVCELLVEFGCLSFIRKYILLNTFIVIVLSILFGFICLFLTKKGFNHKKQINGLVDPGLIDPGIVSNNIGNSVNNNMSNSETNNQSNVWFDPGTVHHINDSEPMEPYDEGVDPGIVHHNENYTEINDPREGCVDPDIIHHHENCNEPNNPCDEWDDPCTEDPKNNHSKPKKPYYGWNASGPVNYNKRSKKPKGPCDN